MCLIGLVIFIGHLYLCDTYVASSDCSDIYQKDMCLKEIEMQAQKYDTHLGSTIFMGV